MYQQLGSWVDFHVGTVFTNSACLDTGDQFLLMTQFSCDDLNKCTIFCCFVDCIMPDQPPWETSIRCRWWERWLPWAPLREEKNTHTLQLGFFWDFPVAEKQRGAKYALVLWNWIGYVPILGERLGYVWNRPCHENSESFIHQAFGMDSLLGKFVAQIKSKGEKMDGKSGRHGWKITSSWQWKFQVPQLLLKHGHYSFLSSHVLL